MALVVPNVGEGIWLKAVVNHTPPQNLVLRLYQNDVDPQEADGAEDYEEADFTGYRPILLRGPDWVVEEGKPSSATMKRQVFTATEDRAEPQTIYGYFVTQVKSGLLVSAERLSNAPVAILFRNDTIAITLQLTLE